MPAPARFPRSDHCDGRHCYNPHHHVNRSWAELLHRKLTTRAAPWPRWVETTVTPPPPAPTRGPRRPHPTLARNFSIFGRITAAQYPACGFRAK